MALTADGHRNDTFLLTGPELLTARERVRILSGVLGEQIRYVDQSVATAADEMREAGAPSFMIDAVMEVMTVIRSGRAAVVTSTVEDVTGRTPGDFRTWCREHVAAFRAG